MSSFSNGLLGGYKIGLMAEELKLAKLNRARTEADAQRDNLRFAMEQAESGIRVNRDNLNARLFEEQLRQAQVEGQDQPRRLGAQAAKDKLDIRKGRQDVMAGALAIRKGEQDLETGGLEQGRQRALTTGIEEETEGRRAARGEALAKGLARGVAYGPHTEVTDNDLDSLTSVLLSNLGVKNQNPNSPEFALYRQQIKGQIMAMKQELMQLNRVNGIDEGNSIQRQAMELARPFADSPDGATAIDGVRPMYERDERSKQVFALAKQMLQSGAGFDALRTPRSETQRFDPITTKRAEALITQQQEQQLIAQDLENKKVERGRLTKVEERKLTQATQKAAELNDQIESLRGGLIGGETKKEVLLTGPGQWDKLAPGTPWKTPDGRRGIK